MALQPATFTGQGWIPVGNDPEVIQQIKNASFIETYGTTVPMTTSVKVAPRSGGVKMGRVGKGATYNKDNTSVHDTVTVYADKIGGIVELDQEDIVDSIADLTATLTYDAAAAYGRLLDNACLGITAAKGTSGWLFDSLYYLLTQSEATTGYVANSNITQTATGGLLTYANLSDSLAKLEGTKWYNPQDVVVAAHPSIRGKLRKIRADAVTAGDGAGLPIFVESSNGSANGGATNPDTVFGYPIHWTLGAATSGVGEDSPAGNPFLVWAMKKLIRRGDREELHAMFAPADSGYGFDSDVAGLKFRARKGFAPGALPGFSLLEVRA